MFLGIERAYIRVAMFFHGVKKTTFLVTKVVYRYRVTLFGVGNFPRPKKHIRVEKERRTEKRSEEL